MAELAENEENYRRSSGGNEASGQLKILKGRENAHSSSCTDNYEMAYDICQLFLGDTAEMHKDYLTGTSINIENKNGKVCVGIIVLYWFSGFLGHFIPYLKINDYWYNGDNEYGYLRKLSDQSVSKLRLYVNKSGEIDLLFKVKEYILFYIDPEKIVERDNIDYSGYPCFGQTSNTCGPDSLQTILMLANGFYDFFNKGMFSELKPLIDDMKRAPEEGGSINVKKQALNHEINKKIVYALEENNKEAGKEYINKGIQFVLNMFIRFNKYDFSEKIYTKMENNSPEYITIKNSTFNKDIHDICALSDRNIVISSTFSLEIRVISIDDRLLKVLKGHTKGIYCMCVLESPEGQRIISGSGDNTLRIWDWQAPEGSECLRVLNLHTNYISSVCTFNIPGDTRIVSGSFDKTLRIWDSATGECLRVLKGHTLSVKSVCVIITPEKHMIVSGSIDKTLRVWDSTTGELIRVLEGHTNYIYSVCTVNIPGGQRIVSGSADNTLRIWDLQRGKGDECVAVLEGHKNIVLKVYILKTADGEIIISGSDDTTLRIWNPITARCIKVLEGYNKLPVICQLDYGRILFGIINIYMYNINVLKGGSRRNKTKRKIRRVKKFSQLKNISNIYGKSRRK